jgi:hypothetical protein
MSIGLAHPTARFEVQVLGEELFSIIVPPPAIVLGADSTYTDHLSLH